MEEDEKVPVGATPEEVAQTFFCGRGFFEVVTLEGRAVFYLTGTDGLKTILEDIECISIKYIGNLPERLTVEDVVDLLNSFTLLR